MTLTREEKKKFTQQRKRRQAPGPEYWGTADELRYLKNIGDHKAFPAELSRNERLRRYRNSLVHKVFWGDVDKELIMAYLKVEIGA